VDMLNLAPLTRRDTGVGSTAEAGVA
jgi:hypothetical protein